MISDAIWKQQHKKTDKTQNSGFWDSEVVTVKDSDPCEMEDNDEFHDAQALAFSRRKYSWINGLQCKLEVRSSGPQTHV